MKKKSFFEVLSGKLHSEKGTAAIITLSVIIVLTALGTVALLASAMNVRMSGRTISWSKDYYILDTMAEKYVSRIDDEVLIPAEKDARTYVMNRLDRVGYGSMTGYFEEAVFAPSEQAQEFFNEYYELVWTFVDTGESEGEGEGEGGEGEDEGEGEGEEGGGEEEDEGGSGEGEEEGEGEGESEGGSGTGTGTRREYTVQDYERFIGDGTIESISANYYKYRNELHLSNSEKAARAYKDDLLEYTEALFGRVYFHMVSKRLEQLHDDADDPDFPGVSANIVIKGKDYEHYGEREETAHNRCTYRFINITSGGDVRNTWNSLEPGKGDITLYLRAKHDDVPNKEVRVAVEVALPEYDIIEKIIYKPVLGNPIWANALTVRGSINIGANARVTIEGDVYASGRTGTPDEAGISVNSNADVDIYGNVYTAGNVHVTGDGGELRVYTSETGSSAVSYSYKRAIYDSDYLHERNTDYGFSPDHTADQAAGTPNVPFVFKDFIDRGNVYCESLEVAEGVTGGRLTVDGNLWTMDDIQMDGRQSEISVGTTEPRDGKNAAKYTYVGLNGESDLNDPNRSSSVINNFAFNSDGTPDSRIILNSNFIVPGVAFYNFFLHPDPGAPDVYYKSIESVTSRVTMPAPMISAYTDPSGSIELYNKEGDEFRLIDDEYHTQRNALVNYILGIGGGVYTNIGTNLSEPAGFVAGVALVEKMSGGTSDRATVYTHDPDESWPSGAAAELVNSGYNNAAFSDLSVEEGGGNKLFRLYTAKTKMLGRHVANYVRDAEPVGFDELVHKSILNTMGLNDIVMITAGGTLNVGPGGIDSGIVYCDGDLTISGSGEFKGTVICEGDVYIEGDVKITYDESEIGRKLRNSRKLRDFFSKGEMGLKLFDVEEISTTSGERVQVKRYRITAWRETAK
jgi:hypothetical protein